MLWWEGLTLCAVQHYTWASSVLRIPQVWIGRVGGDERLRLRRDGGEETFLIEPDAVTAPPICRVLETGASDLSTHTHVSDPSSKDALLTASSPSVSGSSYKRWQFAAAVQLEGRRPAQEREQRADTRRDDRQP